MKANLSGYFKPFLPGAASANPGPLARYLPPIPEGIVTEWLQSSLPPSPNGVTPAWILDPFGTAPSLIIEAAQAGYRVLVAANNPVARFLIEMSANPPSASDLQAALAELAGAFKGSERLEPHIRSLYQTACSNCGQPVMAEAFLWERTGPSPFAAIYTCPYCGSSGEHPVSLKDINRAAQFGSGGLHHARALERIASPDDPDRVHAQEALSVYLPRAVYALFTLINKLDGLNLPMERRRMLEALLLVACDQANTLWNHPVLRDRPKQLTFPPRFRENNVWLALEQAIMTWTSQKGHIPLTYWPDQPPESGGICLFEGRLRDLSEQLEKLALKPSPDRIDIGAVIAALPRPNQAYWTLSALWAGWLWGREAVGPFKSVLRRQRYDWSWHTSGLFAAFNSLAPRLMAGTPMLGLIGESEPGFLCSALIAAELAGFRQDGLAVRPGADQAQLHWKITVPDEDEHKSVEEPRSLAESSAIRFSLDFLLENGQPASYLPVYMAAMIGLQQAGYYHKARSLNVIREKEADQDGANTEIPPTEIFNRTQIVLKDALSYRGGFLRFGAGETPETGLWWLREPEKSQPPLFDRIENEMVNFLIEHPGCSIREIENSMYKEFPGLLTPSPEFLHFCLESYAIQEPSGSDHWRLRLQETPATRQVDVETARSQLEQIATRSGFQTQGFDPIQWIDSNGQAVYAFYILASARIGEIILGYHGTIPNVQRSAVIVLPGGRSNLVAYRLRHDPRLKNLVTDKTAWRFLKFRHLRWLIENALLDRGSLDDVMFSDALTYTEPQMRLL